MLESRDGDWANEDAFPVVIARKIADGLYADRLKVLKQRVQIGRKIGIGR